MDHFSPLGDLMELPISKLLKYMIRKQINGDYAAVWIIAVWAEAWVWCVHLRLKTICGKCHFYRLCKFMHPPFLTTHSMNFVLFRNEMPEYMTTAHCWIWFIFQDTQGLGCLRRICWWDRNERAANLCFFLFQFLRRAITYSNKTFAMTASIYRNMLFYCICLKCVRNVWFGIFFLKLTVVSHIHSIKPVRQLLYALDLVKYSINL